MRVETDALQVVRFLNQQDQDETEVMLFVDEAQALSNKRNIESFTSVARDHNGVAHHLARKACLMDVSKSWVNDFPNWLSSLNEYDTGLINFTSGGSCLTGSNQMDIFLVIL